MKSVEELRLLNLSAALRFGLITWDQYFELVLYNELKLSKAA